MGGAGASKEAAAAGAKRKKLYEKPLQPVEAKTAGAAEDGDIESQAKSKPSPGKSPTKFAKVVPINGEEDIDQPAMIYKEVSMTTATIGASSAGNVLSSEQAQDISNTNDDDDDWSEEDDDDQFADGNGGGSVNIPNDDFDDIEQPAAMVHPMVMNNASASRGVGGMTGLPSRPPKASHSAATAHSMH